MTEIRYADQLQQRVAAMMRHCCEEAGDPTDVTERADRFLEEALELYQVVRQHGCGDTAAQAADRARRVLAYVFSREVGELDQEAGGSMVSLMGLCDRLDVNALDAGDAENERCRDPAVVAKIRAKRALRVYNDPLPGGRDLPDGDGWVLIPTDLSDWPEFFMVWSPSHPDLPMVFRKGIFERARAEKVPQHLSSQHFTHIREFPILPIADRTES